MKLFATQEEHTSSITLEQYQEYLASTDNVSVESISDYFYKLVDLFNSTYDGILSTYNDDDVKYIVGHKLELLNKTKHLNFTVSSENPTEKPANFRGKYVDYLEELYAKITELTPAVLESGEVVKMAISDFINNNNLDKINTVYGYAQVEKQKKIAENHIKEISRYFPLTNDSSRTTFRDVFKTFKDVKEIVEYLEQLDKIANRDYILKVKTMNRSISDLLEHVIKEFSKNNILVANDKVKKDLEKMVYDLGKIIEYYAYLLFNIKNFYVAFRINTDDLLKL